MAYDGFYGELSTRGAANEVLSLAIATKDQIEDISENIIARADQVNIQAQQVASDKIFVNDAKLVVGAQATEVQNNTTFVAQAISNVVLEDAPQDGQNYSRNNGQWVTGSTEPDFYTVDMQFGRTIEFFPGTGTNFNMAKIFPRINLSRPILSECYIRRNTAQATPLQVVIRSNQPASTWQATATINPGQTEGFFTSGTADPLNSNYGIELNATNITAGHDGLAVHLVYQVEPDPTLSALK